MLRIYPPESDTGDSLERSEIDLGCQGVRDLGLGFRVTDNGSEVRNGEGQPEDSSNFNSSNIRFLICKDPQIPDDGTRTKRSELNEVKPETFSTTTLPTPNYYFCLKNASFNPWLSL